MAEGEVGAGGFIGVESRHEAVDPVGIEGLFGTHVKPGDTQAVGVVTVVAAAEFVVFDIEGEEAVVAVQDVFRYAFDQRFLRLFDGDFRSFQNHAFLGGKELLP